VDRTRGEQFARNRHSLLALEYLGPADDTLTEELDVNDDGIVDLADVLAIAGVDSKGGHTETSQPDQSPALATDS